MVRKKRKSFRFFIAFLTSKAIQVFIKMFFKDKGTHMPGKLAMKMCPDFLSRIGRPETVIAITGTNGKTSVSHFVNNIFISSGYKIINNEKGSNMLSGIASSLIDAANIYGNVKEKIAVFEVDERVSGYIYDHIPPTYLLCTNLFRDSIKRNGHSEFILTKIKSSVPKTTTLILNADDLISINIGNKENKRFFFSVNKVDSSNQFKNIVNDISVCPNCKNKLEYEYRHYHHIGKARCLKCDFKSPIPKYIVEKIDLKKRTLTVKEENKKYNYNLISNSVYNLYNIISSIAVARVFGLEHKEIKVAFEKMELKKDRLNVQKIKDKEVITLLSKDQNPISCSRMFDYVSSQPDDKAIVLFITDSKDKVHGSEDISWLYDTDFEYLKKDDIKQIIVGGSRCYDVSLRLKLAGIKDEIINLKPNYENVEEIIKLNEVKKIFILYELYAYPLANKLKENVKRRVGV